MQLAAGLHSCFMGTERVLDRSRRSYGSGIVLSTMLANSS